MASKEKTANLTFHMATAPANTPSRDAEEAARIYFLPNLMTALNLFCGFVAIIKCIQAKFTSQMIDFGQIQPYTPDQLYEHAVWCILAAVIFDALDGRLARLGGRESLFGKEFDSLADVVSFGLAPALMVFFLILSPTESFPIFRQIGWLIGFLYLLCSAIRLARFNVITHPLLENTDASPDFRGLPVPAAAGMISSLVLVFTRPEFEIRHFALFLPILLVLTSFLMVSNIRYPSFKKIGWKTRMRFRTFIGVLAAMAMVYTFHFYAFAIVFLWYIFYGIYRHLRQDRTADDTFGLEIE